MAWLNRKHLFTGLLIMAICMILTAGSTHNVPVVVAEAEIPPPKVETQEQEENIFTDYKVKKGDTLGVIGKRLDTDWKSIASANDIEYPYTLEVNQVLAVPTDLYMFRIMKYIMILSPKIQPEKAERLARQYASVTAKNHSDPKAFVAISWQQNRFRISGINGDDIGHMQINYKYQIINKDRVGKISIEELNTNWRLNTELAAEHLVWCQNNHPKWNKNPWWACYNTSNPDNQPAYMDYVQPFINRMK